MSALAATEVVDKLLETGDAPRRMRRPKEKKFVPEPYSQGPQAHAVHAAGGKMITPPFPSRNRWLSDLVAHAPGCGSPITAIDGLPASGIRCGMTHKGKPVLCHYCAPGA